MVGNFKSQLEESKSILGAGCEGATKGVLDDEADLTAYDGIGLEERMLLLKGFVISKMFFGLKSAVCLKQLGYGLLELTTVFPKLQEVIINIHKKKKDPEV
ncbi:hypothetical protein Tco_0965610 [Tanacetum coccineum]